MPEQQLSDEPTFFNQLSLQVKHVTGHVHFFHTILRNDKSTWLSIKNNNIPTLQ